MVDRGGVDHMVGRGGVDHMVGRVGGGVDHMVGRGGVLTVPLQLLCRVCLVFDCVLTSLSERSLRLEARQWPQV